MDARPAKRPARIRIEGVHVTLLPLDAGEHCDDLWQGMRGAQNDALWKYMAYGPFSAREEFDAHLEAKAASEDPLFYAISNRKSGRAVGHATLMRVDPANRVIEVGGIVYTRSLQRTRGATEAMYLLARYVFEDLGYRRYEWKCDASN